VQNATHISPGKVRPVLSLASYPDEVVEAVMFVFDNTLRSVPSGSSVFV
jgi:hypothetical protein